MNENNNSNNQGYLSGFDSFEQIPVKKEGSINPTPMFSNLKAQNENPATPIGKQAEEIATAKPDNQATPAPSVESAPVSEAPAEQKIEAIASPTLSPEADQPQKGDTPIFIPNGTYSYSAPTVKEEEPIKAPEATAPVNESLGDSLKAEGSFTPPPFNPNTFNSPIIPEFDPKSQEPKPKKEKKTKRYGVGVVAVSAVLAAVLGTCGGVFGTFFANKYFDKTEASSSNQNVQQNVTNITVDETVNSSIEAVARKAGPSIIGIRTTAAVTNFFGGSTEATGEGSGIIYTADGYIITNYHVIESAVESSNSKVEVFLANDTNTAIPATVIGYNIASDLAVVKIEKTGLPAIEFADSDNLNVGQYAVAIGNPGGLEFIGSISSGIISGLNRSVTLGTGNTMSLIQTDAAINPGNSGGALVDIQGNLIGVNSVKLVSTGYEGMGFAIPSNTVKEICNNIIEKQNDPTPYIGIEISQRYSAEQLVALGYPEGAVVVSVAEGGPADESKIQRGDIITEFNGTKIKDYTQLENAISQCKPGDSVTIKIFRAGRFYSSHINIAANNAQ
ncbi:MAG: trypsin-like peptidase domain-containing protein [Clostridia bacterium]|nr:trypsin-like peptidase domain-containing protein [Clostridia bacterium]MBQ9920263.1 trypsin-like peptidase domain-containing protein [Clostridia bacterium]